MSNYVTFLTPDLVVFILNFRVWTQGLMHSRQVLYH